METISNWYIRIRWSLLERLDQPVIESLVGINGPVAASANQTVEIGATVAHLDIRFHRWKSEMEHIRLNFDRSIDRSIGIERVRCTHRPHLEATGSLDDLSNDRWLSSPNVFPFPVRSGNECDCWLAL